MITLLLAVQLSTATPAYMAHLTKKATDDPAVVEASFAARQRCKNEEDAVHKYSVEGRFPQLITDTAAARRINRVIREEVVRLVAYDVPDCPLPVAVSKTKEADGEIECECTVQLRTRRLFSVRCESSTAGEDFGAHPQAHLAARVFDPSDGKQLDLSAMLLEGAMPKFRELLKANLDISGMVDPAKIEPREIDGMIDQMLESCYVDRESVTCEAPYWPVTYFMSAVSFGDLAGIARPEFLTAATAK